MTITKPGIPGTVLGFIGSAAPRVAPAAAETVAIPLVHDWGPVASDPPGSDGRQGGPQLLSQFAEWTGLFGDSDTGGRTAVAGAFAGQGLPDAVGAGGVLVWRMAPGAAAATITIVSRSNASTQLLQLDAYYKGSRGNRITYTLDSDPSDATKDRLQLFFDGALKEVYLFDRTTMVMSDYAAMIAARSTLVRPTAISGRSNARLAPTTNPVALAGGSDGTTPASADHLQALSGLQYKDFGVLAPYNLTNAPIQAAYYSWLSGQLAANRPLRVVFGGAAGEALADAIARSATFNDPHVINVGIGTWHDDLLGKDLSTAQLAPRIAGIIAARGEEHSATFAEIAGLHMVQGPADDELEPAINAGVVTLALTTSDEAEVHILKAVTTYTSDTDAVPYDVFSDARLVGAMDNFVRKMKRWGDRIVIGDLPVNDFTRSLVRGQARQLENALLRRGLILPGNPDLNIPEPWVICDDPGDPALEDTIPFTFGWRFAKTTNNIIGEGQIR